VEYFQEWQIALQGFTTTHVTPHLRTANIQLPLFLALVVRKRFKGPILDKFETYFQETGWTKWKHLSSNLDNFLTEVCEICLTERMSTEYAQQYQTWKRGALGALALHTKLTKMKAVIPILALHFQIHDPLAGEEQMREKFLSKLSKETKEAIKDDLETREDPEPLDKKPLDWILRAAIKKEDKAEERRKEKARVQALKLTRTEKASTPPRKPLGPKKTKKPFRGQGPNSGAARDRSNDICNNCGKRGHWARDCPEAPAATVAKQQFVLKRMQFNMAAIQSEGGLACVGPVDPDYNGESEDEKCRPCAPSSTSPAPEASDTDASELTGADTDASEPVSEGEATDAESGQSSVPGSDTERSELGGESDEESS
jgi:hypothetical protein